MQTSKKEKMRKCKEVGGTCMVRYPQCREKKKEGWESCVYSHMASLLDCLLIVGKSCHPSSTFRVGVSSAIR